MGEWDKDRLKPLRSCFRSSRAAPNRRRRPARRHSGHKPKLRSPHAVAWHLPGVGWRALRKARALPDYTAIPSEARCHTLRRRVGINRAGTRRSKL